MAIWLSCQISMSQLLFFRFLIAVNWWQPILNRDSPDKSSENCDSQIKSGPLPMSIYWNTDTISFSYCRQLLLHYTSRVQSFSKTLNGPKSLNIWALYHKSLQIVDIDDLVISQTESLVFWIWRWMARSQLLLRRFVKSDFSLIVFESFLRDILALKQLLTENWVAIGAPTILDTWEWLPEPYFLHLECIRKFFFYLWRIT